jgi:hypothetical protein
MKCPECVRLGLESRLDEKMAGGDGFVTVKDGAGYVTMMGQATVERFWDGAGQRHVHDHEVRVFVYTCSNGHAFKQVVMSRCPCKGCEWNEQPEVKAAREPLG